MSFQVQTPILRTVTDKLLNVMDGVENEEIDVAKANTIIKAGAGIRNAVETDLKVRLAAPKLTKIEAIDVSPRPAEQIEAQPQTEAA